MDVATLFGCNCIEDMSGIDNSGSQCLVWCKQPLVESDILSLKEKHYYFITAKYAIGLPGLPLQQLQQTQHCAVGHATCRDKQQSSRPHKALIWHISCTNNTCIGCQSSIMQIGGR